MPTRTERLREAIKNIADSDAAERQRQGLQDVPVGSSQNPSTKILTVANVITFCRLALTLVFLALFIRHEPNGSRGGRSVQFLVKSAWVNASASLIRQ